MGYCADMIDYKSKYVSGEQISLAVALSRLRFDDETPEEEKIYFFQINIFFKDTQTSKLIDIESDLQSIRTFQDVSKRIQSGDWRQCSEAESHFKKEPETLTIREEINNRGRCTFHTAEIQKSNNGRYPQDASRKTDKRKGFENGCFVAWHVKRRRTTCPRCEICQKKPSLGKTVSN